MPKHASASLAVLDLVMASPAQPAARRSPRRLCLLSARSDDQPLPRSDQKGKLHTNDSFDKGGVIGSILSVNRHHITHYQQ